MQNPICSDDRSSVSPDSTAFDINHLILYMSIDKYIDITRLITMIETQILILIILLCFSAFFSGVETALMSINMVKVKSLIAQKKKGSETLHRLKQNPHKLIITILIGNNLVNIGAASFATVVFTDLFGSSGVGIATGVMTFMILVFGEITPKTFASQNAEKISLLVARPIEILSIVFRLLLNFLR